MIKPSMNDQQRAEILERVADGYESERYQWIRKHLISLVAGKSGQHEIGYCVIGAINHELQISDEILGREYNQNIRANSPNHVYNQNIRDFIYSVGASIWGAPAAEIYNFNDYPTRTKEEMIEALKNRAKDIRNGESND